MKRWRDLTPHEKQKRKDTIKDTAEGLFAGLCLVAVLALFLATIAIQRDIPLWPKTIRTSK